MSSKKGPGAVPTAQPPPHPPSGSIKDAFASRARTESMLTTEEIRGDKKQEIRSAEDGIKYLEEDSPFHMHGESHSLNDLADSLFHISRACKGSSASVTKIVVSSIRAIAFILQDAATEHNDRLTPAASTLTDAIDLHLRSATDSFLTSLDAAVASTMKKIIENATEVLAKITVSTNKITESAKSYSDILKLTTAPARPGQPAHQGLHPRQKATQAIKDRRILIDFTSAEALQRLKTVSNTALVEKANLSLRVLDNADGRKFHTATRIRNGGVLMEMSNADDIAWLTSTDIKDLFLTAFEPTASFKPPSFSIFVQFIPFSFTPSTDIDLREIEEVNSMARDSVIRAKWVKPPTRRAKSQSCGHLILTLSSPQAANKILTDGLRIAHKLVFATKC